MARKKKNEAVSTKRKRGKDREEAGSESEEDTCREDRRQKKDVSPPNMQVETTEMSDYAGRDGVSSINQGESVTDQDRWKKMEDWMKNMEERVDRGKDDGGVSVVSGATSTPPANERILKENLRKFVGAKVFPSWKFIFKKEKLGMCVISAIGKSYITTPPGFEERQLAELYGPTIRTCLDGCRANAQTAARKRYLSKFAV